LRVEFLGPLEDLERAGIDGLGTDALIQTRNGLDVVIEDVGFGLHDDAQGVVVALKVGSQDLYRAFRIDAANPADGSGEEGRASVAQFVTVDRGDDAVTQTHRFAGLGHAARLFPVKGHGAPGGDGAKAAAARANAAQNHKGGCAVAPAFANIWAARLFANGV